MALKKLKSTILMISGLLRCWRLRLGLNNKNWRLCLQLSYPLNSTLMLLKPSIILFTNSIINSNKNNFSRIPLKALYILFSLICSIAALTDLFHFSSTTIAGLLTLFLGTKTISAYPLPPASSR